MFFALSNRLQILGAGKASMQEAGFYKMGTIGINDMKLHLDVVNEPFHLQIIPNATMHIIDQLSLPALAEHQNHTLLI